MQSQGGNYIRVEILLNRAVNRSDSEQNKPPIAIIASSSHPGVTLRDTRTPEDEDDKRQAAQRHIDVHVFVFVLLKTIPPFGIPSILLSISR